jgi:DNA-directed RNA polymerase I, II, and III subunit RPABC1
MFVLFAEQHTVSGDDLKAYMSKMKDGSVRRAIIVYESKITPMARQQIEEMKGMAYEGREYHFEVFKDKELMINVTRHELVPKHSVLSEEEKASLLLRYGLKESELGRIQVMDPVARYFGMSVGQVFKIVRSSQTAGRYVSYRIVV